MTIRLVGSEIVHMEKGTFMWIQLTHFAVEVAQDELAQELNDRPRQTLGFRTPSQALADVLR